MNLRMTFKHMDTSEAIERHCRETILKRTEKFSNNIMDSDITFAHEHDENIVQCKMTDIHGKTYLAHETGEDMYKCIDILSHKLERLLRKEKNMHISHKAFRTKKEFLKQEQGE